MLLKYLGVSNRQFEKFSPHWLPCRSYSLRWTEMRNWTWEALFLEINAVHLCLHTEFLGLSFIPESLHQPALISIWTSSSMHRSFFVWVCQVYQSRRVLCGTRITSRATRRKAWLNYFENSFRCMYRPLSSCRSDLVFFCFNANKAF